MNNLSKLTRERINNKIVQLQTAEARWRTANGGHLEGWQEYRLKEGINDVQIMRALLAALEAKPDTRAQIIEEIISEKGGANWYKKLSVLKDYRDTLLNRFERYYDTQNQAPANILEEIKALAAYKIEVGGIVARYKKLKSEYE